MILDTNVLSELVRPRPDPRVVRWARGVQRYALSVVTIEEIAYGLALRPNARVRAALDVVFRAQATILPVDERVARRAGALRGALGRGGQVREQADMLIAATALVHGLALATRNVRDFDGCGIELVDPFAPGD